MSNTQSNKTQKQVVGEIGENCACEFLKNKGFKIIDRNYLRKWGEIDVVAKNKKKIHFVEVKSVSKSLDLSVTHETNDGYRPEDNVHPWKLKRLGRAIQTYLSDKNIKDNTPWQFDIITVYVDMEKKKSRVFILEDIIL